MEYSSGALLIAGEIGLRKLDKFQGGFFYKLGLDDRLVFMQYNFAPPSLRRAIDIFGFLHKINLGACHPALRLLFPARMGEANMFHSMQFESFLPAS